MGRRGSEWGLLLLVGSGRQGTGPMPKGRNRPRGKKRHNKRQKESGGKEVSPLRQVRTALLTTTFKEAALLAVGQGRDVEEKSGEC